MNLAAVIHESTLPFRQPLARNRIRFRLLAAQGDLAAVTLVCWKRSEPRPDAVREYPMAVRYADGVRAEWLCEAAFAEEAHYLKYYFLLQGVAGETICFCENGFSDTPPETGYFELLQAFETDVSTLPAWSRGTVYYQIFPERFAVGDPAKPYRDYEPWGAKPTRENYLGGDLKGIRAKLPYLENLGAECLYLNPVFMADGNHKYATADYFTVDLDFGTNDDLIALVADAHAMGIRVLLDGVFNHAGPRFAPFADLMKNGEASPYRDWFYVKRYPVTLDAACYECVGDYAPMPRLRTANPAVRAFILKVMLYWLDTARIDGWRLDVADELDAATLRWLREQIRTHHPDALLLGETWGDATRMVCEGDQLDCAMNYLFRDAMVGFFAKGNMNAEQLDHRLQHMLMKYPDAVNLAMYNCLGSHDTVRFLTEAGDETWRLRLAVAFQMLFVGSPAVYYGDELGMTGENDPGCRGGMAWQNADAELMRFVREMIAVRKGSQAARLGAYRTLVAQGDVFAFERTLDGKRLTAVFNRGGEPATLDLADGAGTVTVPPRSVKIIQ